MPLGKRSHTDQRGERGAPHLKRRYFTAISLINVKMIADRHILVHAA